MCAYQVCEGRDYIYFVGGRHVIGLDFAIQLLENYEVGSGIFPLNYFLQRIKTDGRIFSSQSNGHKI